MILIILDFFEPFINNCNFRKFLFFHPGNTKKFKIRFRELFLMIIKVLSNGTVIFLFAFEVQILITPQKSNNYFLVEIHKHLNLLNLIKFNSNT